MKGIFNNKTKKINITEVADANLKEYMQLMEEYEKNMEEYCEIELRYEELMKKMAPIIKNPFTEDCSGKRKKYTSVLEAVMNDDNLNSRLKAFYKHILRMCRATGYCYATDGYFANYYRVRVETVRSWIDKLIERGYITSETTIVQRVARRLETKVIERVERQLRVNKAILEIKNKENKTNE